MAVSCVVNIVEVVQKPGTFEYGPCCQSIHQKSQAAFSKFRCNISRYAFKNLGLDGSNRIGLFWFPPVGMSEIEVDDQSCGGEAVLIDRLANE